MTVSISVTMVVSDSIRQSNNATQATIAYYAAEGALEEALLANKHLGIGQSAPNTPISPEKGFKGSYTISGQTAVANDDGKVFTNQNPTEAYIIPAPYTGNTPWTGKGSVPGGGCNPAKPPEMFNAAGQPNLTPAGNKYFSFSWIGANGNPGVSNNQPESEHPCNWSKLALGQKVTIPLFGYDSNDMLANMPSFILRLRTPCANGQEYCLGNERKMLDCKNNGDKSSAGDKFVCSTLSDANAIKKGDVVVLWQIEAANGAGATIAMLPNEYVNPTSGYFSAGILGDTQLNEGKINSGVSQLGDFRVLDIFTDTVLKGKIGETNPAIKSILTGTHVAPTLKLSAIGKLTECVDGLCSKGQSTYQKNIPYLEYQIQFPNAAFAPANTEKIITVEGSSGQFTQKIQVKVPTGSSNLDYVIQQ